MKNKKEIQINKEYIIRLKHYTDRVKETADNCFAREQAIIALLGYLEAVEILTSL